MDSVDFVGTKRDVLGGFGSPFLGILGTILAVLGAILPYFWGHFGHSEGQFDIFWGHFGRFRGHSDRFWGSFWPVLGSFKPILGPFWPFLGSI